MAFDHIPEFALSFTAEAVHLLRRHAAANLEHAWDSIGQVPFASPDFREDLAQLREAAEAGSGSSFDGLAVLLVIPHEQILYTSLDIPAGPQRDLAVGKALDGLTPYTIDELAFDWVEEGGAVRVAAVARQTLIEAFEFAHRHGFASAGYSAFPDEDDYPGMPVFLLDEQTDDDIEAAICDADPLDPLPEGGGEDDDSLAAPPPQKAGSDEAGFAARPAPQQVGRDDSRDPDDTPDGFSMRKAVIGGTGADADLPGQSGFADLHRSQPFSDLALPCPPARLDAVEVNVPGADDEAIKPVTAAKAVTAKATPKPAPPAASTAQGKGKRKNGQKEKAKLVARPHMAPEGARAAVVQADPVAATSPAVPTVVRHGAPAVAAVAQGRRMPGQRGGLVELVAMLGALIVGLLLVWAFFVPRDHPAQQPGPDLAVNDMPVQERVTPTDEVVAPDQIAQADPVAADPVQPVADTVEPAAQPQPAAPAAMEAPVQPPVLSEVERALAFAASTAAVEAVLAPAALPVDDATRTGGVEARVAKEEADMAAIALAEQQAREAAAQLAQDRQVVATSVAADAVVVSPAPAPVAAPAPQSAGLIRSARPATAPRRAAPVADAPPNIPPNPLPFEAAQRPVLPKISARPPSRPALSRPAPASSPEPQPASRPQTPPAPAPAASRPDPAPVAAAPAAPVASNLRSSSRPPARPEGAAPDDLASQPLTVEEQHQIHEMLRDFHARNIGPAGAGRQAMVQPSFQPYRLADLRPLRRPASLDSAPRDASEAAPPDRPAVSPVRAGNSATPARESGGLLTVSARPASRPAGRAGAQASAVDAALSEAVSSAAALPPALPGGVAGMTALTSSRLPPRRSTAAGAPPAGSGAVASLAAPARNDEAEQAERRRLDEQLQSQAEARIRARAAADAAAEAKARADAEARARAQVAAEERAAAARKQTYRPQEVDDEPEIAQQVARGGVTAATVASAATERRGLNMGRTTIIGIIGAGQASRALIRLRNGKIVTVRLGDKIDGGTITAIGNSKVTYMKSGRPHELRMLDGR